MNRVKNMGKNSRLDNRRSQWDLSQLQKAQRANTELRKTIQTLQSELVEARGVAERMSTKLRDVMKDQRDLASIGWVRNGAQSLDIMIDVKLRTGASVPDDSIEKEFRLAIQTYKHYLTKAATVIQELCPHSHLDSMMEVLEGSNVNDLMRQEASIDAYVAEVFSRE